MFSQRLLFQAVHSRQAGQQPREKGQQAQQETVQQLTRRGNHVLLASLERNSCMRCHTAFSSIKHSIWLPIDFAKILFGKLENSLDSFGSEFESISIYWPDCSLFGGYTKLETPVPVKKN